MNFLHVEADSMDAALSLTKGFPFLTKPSA